MTTAVTVSSSMAGPGSVAVRTVGNRKRTCARRSGSRSTTHATTLRSWLSKFRMRFGPHCPAPRTATLIMAGARSPAQPEPDVDERPQDRPPSDDWAHLRLSERLGRVDLGHRHLGRPVAESDRAQVQVGLQLVLVQPRLIEVDVRVGENARADCPEAVGRLADPAPRHEREEEGVRAG